MGVEPRASFQMLKMAAPGLLGLSIAVGAYIALSPDSTSELSTAPITTTTTALTVAPDVRETEEQGAVSPSTDEIEPFTAADVRDLDGGALDSFERPGDDVAGISASTGDTGDQAAAAADGGASAAPTPEPVRIARPSCADSLGASQVTTSPLAGTSASIPAGLPAVVVKVSNNSSASRRALIGLDQADIVFEERIEARATRFAAVFHSQLPENVGPVRSGRTTDISLMRNLNTPVFGYSGSNRGVARQISEAASNGWLVPFINTDRAPFARDSRFNAPDNLFVDPASLGACGAGGTPSPVFRYGGGSSSAQSASAVDLEARSPFRFVWDPASGTWLRSQDGTAHVTRSGAPLAPANVIVLFVNYVQSAIDAASVDAVTTGTGEAWMFGDGNVTVGSWTRNRATDEWNLRDANRNRVLLRPGQTWVVLAPAGSATWR